MKSSKFMKTLAAAAMGVAISLVAPLAASANTGGGTGGGGNSGSVTGSFIWASIAYDQKGRAWSEFLNRAQGNVLSERQVIGEVNGRVGNTRVCEESQVIWYVYSPSSNYWIFNFDGQTNRFDGGGSPAAPAWQFGQRGPTAGEVQAFYHWDATVNGNRVNADPGYTIICSGTFVQPDRNWSEQAKRTVGNPRTVSFTQPYTWTSQVTPQAIDGKTDPIGKKNLNAQVSPPVKSEFGKLYDSLSTAANKGMTPEQLRAAVDKAVAADRGKDHGTVELNQGNKEGMAEGGILNVNEQTRYANVSSTETVYTEITTTCNYNQTWNIGAQAYNPPTRSCSDASREVARQSTANKTMGTQANTGFWQMISVHCNQLGFNNLIAAGNGIQVVESGDPSKAISAVAYTKKYDRQPARLDFGDKSNPNAAMKATSSLSFFDKECPFDCTPDASAPGASQSNGADKNVGGKNAISSNEQGKDGGLAAETANGNLLQIFRDNEMHPVKVDTWFPVSGGVVNYDGAAPLTTTFTKWNQGTPNATTGGEFQLLTKDKKNIFNNSVKGDPKNQRNWDTTTINMENTAVLPGLQNFFYARGSWASEANRPQILNIKFEYAPSVSTNVFTKVGFGAGSAQKTGPTETLATPIQGKCYTGYGDKVPTALVASELQANTGTGVPNNLDNKMIQGTANGGDANTVVSNLVLNFVRATTS